MAHAYQGLVCVWGHGGLRGRVLALKPGIYSGIRGVGFRFRAWQVRFSV